MLQVRPFVRRRAIRTFASSLVLLGLLTVIGQRPAAAAVTAVKGEACTYFVNVGLFGGPQTLNGCNELVSGVARPPGPTPAPGSTTANDPSYSPHVRLPANGSGGSMAATDANGAKAQFGPAVIHGGKWPCAETGDRNCPASAPPSGPQSANVSGTPASGTVTASADISLHPVPVPVGCYPGYGPSCYSIGGFGPFPSEGDSLHVECTANQSGVTGSTTLSNAILATSTDAEGSPVDMEPVPANPPPNYTRHGVITNVGDVFTIVYNQQIINPDGSLTVNGIHMYLMGPVAVGELVRGQVTCGTTPSAAVPGDTIAPSCGAPVVKPMGPEDPTPQVPRSELVGTFDAQGIHSVSNIQVQNGTVTVGDPSSSFDHLKFSQGMTGPLPITATRSAAAESANLPMVWSFDVRDMAGNIAHCRGFLGGPPDVVPVADFDGDKVTERAVYRNGAWYAEGLPAAFFGLAGDIPVPGDYNGDNVTDEAVYRGGAWYVDGQATVYMGLPGDIPVPGDYDGDGTTDRAVFRNGAWYVEGQLPVYLGLSGYIPVPGDYDGDGVTERAVYRDGAWYVEGMPTSYLGLPGDVPVPGNYDADPAVERAVYRNGAWYVEGQAPVYLGLNGYVPVPGDYDGDGTTDPAVFRDGAWYVEGQPTVFHGLAGDIPLSLPHAIYRTLS